MNKKELVMNFIKTDNASAPCFVRLETSAGYVDWKVSHLIATDGVIIAESEQIDEHDTVGLLELATMLIWDARKMDTENMGDAELGAYEQLRDAMRTFDHE